MIGWRAGRAVGMRAVVPGAHRDAQATRAGGASAGAGGSLTEGSAGLRHGFRSGSALAVTVVCLILAARLAAVTAGSAYGQVPFTVALFVLPVLYTIPRTRPLLSRHRWTALVVQAALTWVPLAVFGSNWQLGIDGLLAGLVLLLVPGWVSWLVAGGLLAAEVIVRVVVTGVPISPGCCRRRGGGVLR